MQNKETEEILNILCKDVPSGFIKNSINPVYLFLQKLAINIQKLKIDMDEQNKRNDIRYAVGSDLDNIGRFCFGTVRRFGENDFDYRSRCFLNSNYYEDLALSIKGIQNVFIDFDDNIKKIKISYISDQTLNKDLVKTFSNNSRIGDSFVFIKMKPVFYSVEIIVSGVSITSKEQDSLLSELRIYCSNNFDVQIDKIKAVIYGFIGLFADVEVKLKNYKKRTEEQYSILKGIKVDYV